MVSEALRGARLAGLAGGSGPDDDKEEDGKGSTRGGTAAGDVNWGTEVNLSGVQPNRALGGALEPGLHWEDERQSE